MKLRIPTWIFGIASAVCALAAAYIFLSGAATASLRFGYCGPTSLDQPEQYCRIGSQLLVISCALGVVALLLFGATVWLFRHRRKGSNNSFKPNPLRGSA